MTRSRVTRLLPGVPTPQCSSLLFQQGGPGRTWPLPKRPAAARPACKSGLGFRVDPKTLRANCAGSSPTSTIAIVPSFFFAPSRRTGNLSLPLSHVTRNEDSDHAWGFVPSRAFELPNTVLRRGVYDSGFASCNALPAFSFFCLQKNSPVCLDTMAAWWTGCDFGRVAIHSHAGTGALIMFSIGCNDFFSTAPSTQVAVQRCTLSQTHCKPTLTTHDTRLPMPAWRACAAVATRSS